MLTSFPSFLLHSQQDWVNPRYFYPTPQLKVFCAKKSSCKSLSTAMIIFRFSKRDSFLKSFTILEKLSSYCKMVCAWFLKNPHSGLKLLKKGSNTCIYLVYEISQFRLGKYLLWAKFLSNPQKTWTMERVVALNGLEKSPPGGLTAPTTVTVP